MHIERLTVQTATEALPQLVALLKNCVDAGASIGFLPPMDEAEGYEYWRGRLAAIKDGTSILLVVREDGRIAGAVQLAIETRPNGAHRGEVQKLMVHTDFRRRGLASTLMDAIEAEARKLDKKLLFLDTREGDASEKLYQGRGYQKVGVLPDYVINPDGSLVGTVFYYLKLADE